MRGEWGSSTGGDQSESRVMEEKIRRLTRRTKGLEWRKRRDEEKSSRVSSSESEDGNEKMEIGRHRVVLSGRSSSDG